MQTMSEIANRTCGGYVKIGANERHRVTYFYGVSCKNNLN